MCVVPAEKNPTTNGRLPGSVLAWTMGNLPGIVGLLQAAFLVGPPVDGGPCDHHWANSGQHLTGAEDQPRFASVVKTWPVVTSFSPLVG
jgi:hypothetical protein